MTKFDDREKAYENKYAHDKELQFKVAARRNRLLGLWAAEKMSKNTGDANEYAAQVAEKTVENNSDESVKKKIIEDLRNAGIAVQESEVISQMAVLLEKAKEQVEEQTQL